MKRIWLLIAAAAVAVTMGNLFHGVDLGKLQPMQVVYIQQDGGKYLVTTDIGETGYGVNLEDAISAMKQSASAEIFMDTADYLLLDMDCMTALTAAYDILRPGTEVCFIDGSVDLEEVAGFLSVHEPKITLAQCMTERDHIPILKIREGRMEIIEQID